MATLKTWSLCTEDLEHIMNQSKDALLGDLLRCKTISKQQFEELSKTKMIIIREKSKISCLFKRLLKKGEEEYPTILVGTISSSEDNDGEEKQGSDKDEGKAEETSSND